MQDQPVSAAKNISIPSADADRLAVTVLTPAYNRADGLSALWESLCAQTSKNFSWLIIDDGSTDDTKSAVLGFIEKSDFDIEYIKKENGGKHTALNLAISCVKTPLSFIVDSDDTLTPDAIETIEKSYEEFGENSDICGFSFLRAYRDGRINGKPFPKDFWVESYINARINSNDMNSDKAEVYKTECLREFPFPEFSGERFLGEDVVWIRMARKYKTVHINSAIYIGEYQSDGLTKNRRIHNMNSPNGCVARASEYLYSDICLKMRIKGYLQYLVYGRVAGRRYGNLIKDVPSKIIFLLLILPAFLIRVRWQRQIKN